MKKLSKLFNQLWKQEGKRDGFAINLTPEIVEVLRKDNSKIKPDIDWFIINPNDIPMLYYLKEGVEHTLTIKKYYSREAIDNIAGIISNLICH